MQDGFYHNSSSVVFARKQTKTIIHDADSWKSYWTSKLAEESFDPFQVSYKYNFVDPETWKHTQKIERQ